MKEYLIVDGYNVINGWDELKNESIHSLEVARNKLLDIISDYQSYRGVIAIVVFDAHYVKNSMEKHEMYNNVEVVYTKEFESADNYIERLVTYLSKEDYIRVVTSDWVEQLVVLGLGAVRVPVRELKEEVAAMKKSMAEKYINKLESKKNLLESNLNPEIRSALEKWRREGNKT
ncbi:MAG: NYN domain-containing protein [Caulobacteraceae bacterium]